MILISPGHYPQRPGACDGPFCEHAEAVRWANCIMDNLPVGIGLLVPVGTLKTKVDFINKSNPTIAAEVHFNSFKVWEDANEDGLITDDELKHAGKGCETLYYPDSKKGALLASEVQNSIAPEIYLDRGIKPGWYRMNPDNGPDFFLSKTKCTAIILEPEFIHLKLSIQNNMHKACGKIAGALLNFYNKEKK